MEEDSFDFDNCDIDFNYEILNKRDVNRQDGIFGRDPDGLDQVRTTDCVGAPQLDFELTDTGRNECSKLKDLQSVMWHEIESEVRYADAGRLPLNSITPHLKEKVVGLNPIDLGFEDGEQMIKSFSERCTFSGEIEIHQVIQNEESLMPPELVYLTGKTQEEFESKKLNLMKEYGKAQMRLNAKNSGTYKRIKQQELMEKISMYMDEPEEVRRIPVRRGTRLFCFAVSVGVFPTELSVVPISLYEEWIELKNMLGQWFTSKDGDLANPICEDKKLVVGQHVVVHMRFTVEKLCVPAEYHRAQIIEILEDQKIRVELYDRGIFAVVHPNKVRRMTPKIYFFAPAFALRIKISIDPIKYPRAVEQGFGNRSKLKDELQGSILPMLRYGNLLIDFLEELPPKFSNDVFWLTDVQWQLEETYVPEELHPYLQSIPKDEPEEDFIHVNSIITTVFGECFDEAYKSYIVRKGNDEGPIVLKMATYELEPQIRHDWSYMDNKDFFRVFDDLYPAPKDDDDDEELDSAHEVD